LNTKKNQEFFPGSFYAWIRLFDMTGERVRNGFMEKKRKLSPLLKLFTL
jgi:hypothetical protein